MVTQLVHHRDPHPVDHEGVPMHRITEFAPNLTIGGSASRRPPSTKIQIATGTQGDDS